MCCAATQLPLLTIAGFISVCLFAMAGAGYDVIHPTRRALTIAARPREQAGTVVTQVALFKAETRCMVVWPSPLDGAENKSVGEHQR